MAKLVSKYSIFLASPSDLSEERQALSEVAEELNLTYGAMNNISIEILKWETHSAPGITTAYPQDLINSDIGSEYDIFIGLLWKKFGTKTQSADSGTEEEFLNAYKRFTANRDNIQILFYFKTSLPNSLNELDPEEFLKVQNFKKSMPEKNIIYWEFDTIENLKGFLRIHIPKRIETILKTKPLSIAQNNTVQIENSNIDELGWLDYSEIFNNAISSSLNSIQKITEDTEWIGNQMSEKAESMNRVTKSVNPNPIVIKELLKRTAIQMNDYSSRINIETPIFYSNFEEAIEAGSNMVNLTDDFYNNTTIDELESTRADVFNLQNGINSAITGMTGFYESVQELPRINKDINNAKNNLLINLDTLITRMKQSNQLVEEYKIRVINKIDNLKINKKDVLN